MGITEGSKVTMQYIGKLEDGTEFDRSEEAKPLQFTFGDGRIIPGLEKGCEGMSLGEERIIKVPVAEAYGQRDESLVMKYPRSLEEKALVPQKGMIVKLNLRNGGAVEARIVDITDTDLVLDLNHPLAGKDLIFEVKVIGLEL